MSVAKDPYKELFEHSADAILIIEGNMFVDCNDAAVKMLRYASRDEVLSAHPSDLSPLSQPDGRNSYEKADEMIAIAFRDGSHRFEWNHKRADGEVFPVEVLLTAVEEEGRRVLHVVWRDITNRKLLEEQLRHAQKMEAVGKLAGGIAHDFNNLLVVIMGHADLLGDDLASNPDLSEHVKSIKDASHRAASLVKQLLAFGRKQQLLPRVIDLNTLVEQMRQLLERLIGEDLRLETDLCDGPLRVKVDPGQIEQVIMNLASNARDASPAGGRLRIVTSKLAVDSARSSASEGLTTGEYAMISVSDEGVGMSTDTAAHAFDPFFTTKIDGSGTGLGLATVYGIVQQSRGTVRINSAQGEGTTVEVLLPITSEPLGREQLEVPEAPSNGGNECVLIVEDEADARSLIAATLDARGYEVIQACDGIEGMVTYLKRADSIDIIVSDVIMPRAGGPQMVRSLNSRGHDPLVLFISGYTDDSLSALHEMGDGVDFLEKPFSANKLASRVRRALDRRTAATRSGPPSE